MQRRVSIKRLKLLRIVTGTIVCNPVPTNGELMEPQHVHYSHLRNGYFEKLRPLVHDRAYKQTTIRSTLNGKFIGGSVFVCDEIFGSRDEIVKNILLLQLGPSLVPFLAILTTASHICRCVNDALLQERHS